MVYKVQEELPHLGREFWLKAESSLRHLRHRVEERTLEERRCLYSAVLDVEAQFHSMKALLEQQERQIEFFVEQHEKMSQKYIDHQVELRMKGLLVPVKKEGAEMPVMTSKEG